MPQFYGNNRVSTHCEECGRPMHRSMVNDGLCRECSPEWDRALAKMEWESKPRGLKRKIADAGRSPEEIVIVSSVPGWKTRRVSRGRLRREWYSTNRIELEKLGLLDATDHFCFVCGSEAEAWHHINYASPTEVIPVCHRCHFRWHRANRGHGLIRYLRESNK
jgi:hypothetical protein